MSKHVAPQIRDNAFADGHHQVKPRRAGEGQYCDHGDHDAEIAVDHGDAFGREPEIDHPPHRDRNHERGDRGDRQRYQRQGGASAVACDIRRQRQKRAQPRAAFGGRLRQFRFDRGYLGRFQIAPRRRFAMPVFKPFHCAHELSTNRFCHPQIGTAASRGKSGKMLIREHTCQILLRSLACFGGV